MIATMSRLRWSLMASALKTSPWQIVALVISLLFGFGLVGLAIGMGHSLGFGPDSSDDVSSWTTTFNTGVVSLGSIVILSLLLIQLTFIGEGSSFSLSRFANYGIPDVQLQLGLTAAGLVGMPSIFGLLSLLFWSSAYRWMGMPAVVISLIAAPIIIVTLMLMCKAVISLGTVFVRTNRGRNAFYTLVFVFMMVVFQLPTMLAGTGTSVSLIEIAQHSAQGPASVMSWTPFGALFQLPFDAAAGDWGLLIARLGIIAVFDVLCFYLAVWCIRRERLLPSVSQGNGVAKGLGMFSHVPDSPSGAISARVASMLKRDPRQCMTYILPIMFFIVFAIQPSETPYALWAVLSYLGLLLITSESNGLAYDGLGFTMEVISGTTGKQNRIGRARVYVAIIAVAFALFGIASFLITGDWKTPEGLVRGFMFTVIGFNIALSCLGVTLWFSTVFSYPVPSIKKPFSSPQGRTASQLFFPFLYMFISLVAALPTIIVGACAAVLHWQAWEWIVTAVSAVNGIGVLCLGTWLGAKIFDARQLKILHTLEQYATLQK
ncbi:ABC transporter permease [Bifidobacterium dolichotidis]|uniref:ABC transporter permease n=1 Tax=Bifidobacterium dolichotidis TaxID=2306976 RepID=A0A430FPW9_9BIFI|nr:ABC transporter permease [Bifidobacterium dolichotidis]RSX54892.1 ABC transporter permease [Bifidobacterium dolichotidis]